MTEPGAKAEPIRPTSMFGRGCLTALGVVGLMAIAAAIAIWGASRYLEKQFLEPDPVTIAEASLQGLKEQNRLSTFQAQYVAVVTSKQTRMGLSAQKTLIMPGTVRYEVDLGKLEQKDVAWNPETKTLSVRLPPLEVVGPQIDLTRIREYDRGGLLMSLTHAEDTLDAANRRAGQAELVRQAREETPMKLARDAARRAVERSFAMPLKAAGVDAKVQALFPDDVPLRDAERWDTTRTLDAVLGNRH